MKRVISLVLAMLLLFSAVPVVFAADDDHDATESLYILSKQCPEEYVDYAKEMAGYIYK